MTRYSNRTITLLITLLPYYHITGLYYLHKLRGIVHNAISSYSILLTTRGAKVVTQLTLLSLNTILVVVQLPVVNRDRLQ